MYIIHSILAVQNLSVHFAWVPLTCRFYSSVYVWAYGGYGTRGVIGPGPGATKLTTHSACMLLIDVPLFLSWTVFNQLRPLTEPKQSQLVDLSSFSQRIMN